jgi:hypothetical protein
MIKRSFLTLAFLAGLLSPAYSAGTISLSLMQQFGTDNKPLNGGLLYFYAAGTTTPQNAYQDSGLTIPWPNPYTLDSTGRIPQLFFADGQIKVRLTNSAGVVQLAADNLLVVGPSGGGGGGGTVDATTVLQTGDIKSRYGTGVHTGWVRLNGRTIGSATSGATERANADAQPLFEYLWQTDANLVVSTGRGASANADWVANKTIALPDARGRVLASLDDMGNTAAGRLTASYFGSAATTLGVSGGFESQTLTIAQTPSHKHDVFFFDSGHTHSYQQAFAGATGGIWPGGGSGTVGLTGATSGSNSGTVGFVHDGNGVSGANKTGLTGSGGAHPIVPPMILVTNYTKL